MEQANNIIVFERLFATISSRVGGNSKKSYTAQLLCAGRQKIADKVMEEAAETIDAALNGSGNDLIRESSDLLYHLLVLWADSGIKPDDVWAELLRREGVSGLDEKKARAKR